MRKKILPIILGLLLMTTTLVVGAADKSVLSEEYLRNPTTSNGYTNITVEQAYDLLTTTSNGIQIPIDIRTNSEWAVAHIDTPAPENPLHWPYLQDGVNLTEFMEQYQGKKLFCIVKPVVER